MDRTEWGKKLHATKTTIQNFSNDKFFTYPDSLIDKVIDEAMLEDASALQKKVWLASMCFNTLSKDAADPDCLFKDTIELRSYPEDTRVHFNAISDEIE